MKSIDKEVLRRLKNKEYSNEYEEKLDRSDRWLCDPVVRFCLLGKGAENSFNICLAPSTGEGNRLPHWKGVEHPCRGASTGLRLNRVVRQYQAENA